MVGLYAQGEAAAVESTRRVLDEMWSSLTIERPDLYPVTAVEGAAGVARASPTSWRETRRFSGGGTLLAQYVSPALAVDKGRQTVHASLSVTFEAVPGGRRPDAVLRGDPPQARRELPGDRATPTFKGGYVDVMRTETPVAVSLVKRFYFAEGGRGCSLSFEAREDVFPRASRWADYIASTLRLGRRGEAAK